VCVVSLPETFGFTHLAPHVIKGMRSNFTYLKEKKSIFNTTYTVCLKGKCTDFPMDELEM
jgi:hypothetical protein